LDVAKKAVLSFQKSLKNSRMNDPGDLLKRMYQLKQVIFSTRAKDPLTKNAINSILYKIKPQSIEKTKTELKKRIFFALAHINDSHHKIAEYGHKKIKRGMVVYTHGFSSSVMSLLLKAKKEGINFEVHNTEARPLLNGRLMASELSRHNIPVKQYSDLALRLALKRADVVLMGADSISEHGQIFSEIGCELITDLAEKYDVPVYICADSWKLNSEAIKEHEKSIELQPKEQLWPKAPRKVTVLNYGFEKINPKLITGIITESGIYKPHYLIHEIKKQCPWI